MCLLSSVEFLCLAWRNDAVWFLYLVLKSFSVSPMYVSVVLLSLRVRAESFPRVEQHNIRRNNGKLRRRANM